MAFYFSYSRQGLKSALRGMARSLRTVMRNMVARRRYPRFSAADRTLFGSVIEAHRPEHGQPVDVVRWVITEWCNFHCAYCNQTHDRHAPRAGGMTAHAFDNHPVEVWMDTFQRHFGKRKVALTITGGEPMLDVRNMNVYLNFIAAADWCLNLRIDTNGSWSPRKYANVDKRKISLNCSYHPSQIAEDRFFANLAAIKEAGFDIGMVNYVLSRSQRDEFRRFQARIEDMSLVMNVSPEFEERLSFTSDELKDLSADILEQDQPYRLAIASPQGKPCLYPAISLEMSAGGHISPGCAPEFGGSFFDMQLPFFGNRIAACPYATCSCLDKYSFLAEFDRNTTPNPFGIYVDALRDLARKRRAGDKPMAGKVRA